MLQPGEQNYEDSAVCEEDGYEQDGGEEQHGQRKDTPIIELEY